MSKSTKLDKLVEKAIEAKNRGDLIEMGNFLHKAFTIDETYPSVNDQFAEYFYLAGKKMEAIGMYRRLRGTPKQEGLDPGNISPWLKEAAILMEIGNFKLADNLFDEMLKIFPDNPNVIKGKEQTQYELANIKYCTRCGEPLNKYENHCLRCGKAKPIV